MKGLIRDLYRLTEPDKKEFDFYDLYYFLREPSHITFRYRHSLQNVRAVEEDGTIVVCFNGKWFRTADDFFEKARIDDMRLTDVYDDLYAFEIEEEEGQWN